MCGIFGFVGDPERARLIDLEAAIRALHHRGPDSSGSFRDEQPLRSISCALAHTRLAILDLSPAGAQPMSTADGRFTINYNGEIYNFRELRRSLELLGEQFVSDCDTEVVLKGFQVWGKDVVHRLRGMFAFAIWNRDRQSLFFARDRLGIKPFYYAQGSDWFAFASEVRTLLATDCAERRLSTLGLQAYFQSGSVRDPETILSGVASLLPGYRGEFVDRQISLECYWALPGVSASVSDYAAAVGSVSSLLSEAVTSELVADVPLGIFLSGGIDSSAITALASRSRDLPVHTFNVTFDEQQYNEERFAAEVASRFGCEHHQVHLGADRAVHELNHLLAALDQPSSDGVNTFFVAEAARRAGLSVALSGLGGDEVFAGYPNFHSFAKLIRTGRLSRPIASWISNGHHRGSAFTRRTNRWRKLADIVSAGGDPNRTYAALRSMFTREQRRALLKGIEPCDDERVPPYTGTVEDPVTLLSTFELSNYLRNTLLRDTDVMSMAHSLEVRVPFLDHSLVECAMGIPGRLKISRDVNKRLLVDATGGLPLDVIRRPKMGFVLPLNEWFRGPLKPRLCELLLGPPIRHLGFLNVDAVNDMWNAFLRGEEFVSYSRVWCIAAFVAWAELNRVAL